MSVAQASSAGSTYNLYGAKTLVDNCKFGRARFWMEMQTRSNDSGWPNNEVIIRNSYFHDSHEDGAIGLVQGDGSRVAYTLMSLTNSRGLVYFEYTAIHDVSVLNNVFVGFSSTNQRASETIQYGSGSTLKSIVVKGNTFKNCRKPRNTGAFSGVAPSFVDNTLSNCVD
jgi:hypothetical protein